MKSWLHKRRTRLISLAALGLIPVMVGANAAAASASTAGRTAQRAGTAKTGPLAGNPGSGNISREFSRAAERATARYWTTSREESAAAVPAYVSHGRKVEAPADTSRPLGRPLVVRPAKPGTSGNPALVAEQLTPQPGPAPAQVYAYPAPYTPYPLAGDGYAVYPNSAHGKLFFDVRTSKGLRPSVCSGTVVTSAGHWLVETAGHCLADPETHTWSLNVEFVPAYRNGHAPFGGWTASALWTKSAWFYRGNFSEDRGFVVLDRNPAGRAIQPVTGSEGIAFNQGYLQNVVSFGYPAEHPFTGETEHLCLASYESKDTTAGPGSLPWGIGCDMTGGSSGGGWVIGYGPSGGYVNGHNDYSHRSRPLEMFTPYFDNSELSLYHCAAFNHC